MLGLVIITLVAQSLEFAAIRFLEGYWGTSMLVAPLYAIGIYKERLRYNYLHWIANWLDHRAFLHSRMDIDRDIQQEREKARKEKEKANGREEERARGKDKKREEKKDEEAKLAAAVWSVGMRKPLTHFTSDLVQEARTYFYSHQWHEYAPSRLRHHISAIEVRLEYFPPSPSRFMPTQLGNILRSTEDRLGGDVEGSKLRGYVIRNLDKFSSGLLLEHDMYRNRLDMYAVLTVASTLLAVLDLVALRSTLGQPIANGTCVALAALSVLSYRGAIAAAQDYGTILTAMDAQVVALARGTTSRP